MLKLQDIKNNTAVSGLEPGQVVRIVTTEPIGDNALTVYYKTPDGKLLERMLFRTDEVNLSLAEAGRPWAFDASGEDFKLAVEAWRINLAHLFDPYFHIVQQYYPLNIMCSLTEQAVNNRSSTSRNWLRLLLVVVPVFSCLPVTYTRLRIESCFHDRQRIQNVYFNIERKLDRQLFCHKPTSGWRYSCSLG